MAPKPQLPSAVLLFTSCSLLTQSSAPDVVYKFRVATTFDVDISTCGSTFDTKLFLLDDPTNLQVALRLVSRLLEAAKQRRRSSG